MTSSSKPIETPKETSQPFNINEGAKGVVLPSIEGSIFGPNLVAKDVAGYAQLFESMYGGGGRESPIESALRSLGAQPGDYHYGTLKSLNAPPTAFAYGRMSFAPDTAVNGGVIQWPGIAPDALKKVCRENVAPQLIIGMRVDDVLRYSELSDQIWRPGWRIEARDKHEKLTDKLKSEIEKAERFILNCNEETGDTEVRARDAKHITAFKRFLSLITRDTLTFDGVAVWTDMDGQDKVKAFAALPAGNIRLTTRDGYEGDKNAFAVAVDEGGTVIQKFTRDQLTWYIRNARTDPEAGGYGWSEVEMAIRVIKGFQNALDINIDIFDKSSIANGIVWISGDAVTPRQLDLLNRMFTNMKKGVTKWWALPVIGLPNGAKMELLDLSRIKGNEAYYKEFMNMLAGALCTIYRFPVRRLGYRISGGHHDATPLPEEVTQRTDEDDPGLAPLLGHIECLINEYILWTRWPHLKFKFMGSSPAEDARMYTLRTEAMTLGERRKEARLPSLESIIEKGEDEEETKQMQQFARVMSLCPTNPDLTTAFTGLASKFFGMEAEGNEEKPPGSQTGRSGDPAKKLAHGHAAGVRRDSAKESSGSKD